MKIAKPGPGALAVAANMLAPALRLAARGTVNRASGPGQRADPAPDLSLIKIELRLGARRPRPARPSKDDAHD